MRGVAGRFAACAMPPWRLQPPFHRSAMAIIETAAGKVSFTEQGRRQGAGRSITLLHGIQGTARSWETVAALLATTHHVMLPDLRGRAGSSVPDDPAAYRPADFAADLSVVLATLGRPTLLVAWSMGVSVTLALLQQYPRTPLAGLVLVSGTACAGDEARWFSGTSIEQVSREAADRARRLALAEAAADHAVAASWLHVQQADYRSLLPGISIPTLVVHGAADDQCPASHGRLMAESIPGARLEEWAGAGHNPMAQDPARMAATILRFADSLPGPV